MIDTKLIIIGCISLSLLIGAWIFALKQDITKLEKEKALLQVEYIACATNEQTLKGTVATQNLEIETQKIDLKKSNDDLKKWQELPPQIKYKTIEKIITKEHSNECEDIKSMLDDIRNSSF